MTKNLIISAAIIYAIFSAGILALEGLSMPSKGGTINHAAKAQLEQAE